MTDNGLFVGIDISKAKHDVAIMNQEKKVLCKPFVIRENRTGYQLLVDKLLQLRQKHQAQTCYIGMEATGNYWKNLYHFLKSQSSEFRVTVVNPVQTRAFAKAELRRAKTDPVNAKDIARYLVGSPSDGKLLLLSVWSSALLIFVSISSCFFSFIIKLLPF